MSAYKQRGSVLLMSLMFMILATMLVIMMVKMTSSHMKVIANQQTQSEAIGAGRLVLSQVMARPTTSATDFFNTFNPALSVQSTQTVDIDNDGTADYSVAVLKPVCKGVFNVPVSSLGSEVPKIGVDGTIANGVILTTQAMLWEIGAQVTGLGPRSGVNVTQYTSIMLAPVTDYNCTT